MKLKFIAAALTLSAATFSVHAGATLKKIPEQPAVSVSKQIDLNKADASSLIGSIKGIGAKRAAAIIAYRDSHHGFKSLEELAEVRGLGQHFVSANREKLHEIFTIN